MTDNKNLWSLLYEASRKPKGGGIPCLVVLPAQLWPAAKELLRICNQQGGLYFELDTICISAKQKDNPLYEFFDWKNIYLDTQTWIIASDLRTNMMRALGCCAAHWWPR